MIVDIAYEKLPEAVSSVKVSTGVRDIAGLLRVHVNRGNIDDAITRCMSDPNVVALQFDPEEINSDLEFLSSKFRAPLDKPILYKIDLRTRDADSISAQEFRGYCEQASPAVRVVFKCPKDFIDMGAVFTTCRAFPNAAFCGGYFLNHAGCNIGCIRQSDIKGRAVGVRKPVTQGCAAVFEPISADEADLLFTVAPTKAQSAKSGTTVMKATSTKTKKSGSVRSESSAKKKTTLFSLSGDGLGAF